MLIWRITYYRFFMALCGVVNSLFVFSQEPQFSQFYASGLYHNPALTGDNIGNRVMANYRNQWAAIDKGYVSYGTYYDKNIKNINSGFGLGVIQDRAGLDGFRWTSSSLFYSYNFKMTRALWLRGGTKFSLSQLNINDKSLVFASDIVNDSPFDRPQINENVMFPNIGAGLMLHNKDRFWVGLAFDHLNRPSYGFSGQQDVRQPIKGSVQLGYNTKQQFGHGGMKQSYFTIMANYKAQEKHDQFDVGTYWKKKGEAFLVGVWYRGIPGLKAFDPKYINHDAINLLVGLKFGTVYFGYSYDITVSRLRRNTGGSHEISMAIEWGNSAKFKPFRTKSLRYIPCAKF